MKLKQIGEYVINPANIDYMAPCDDGTEIMFNGRGRALFVDGVPPEQICEFLNGGIRE